MKPTCPEVLLPDHFRIVQPFSKSLPEKELSDISML